MFAAFPALSREMIPSFANENRCAISSSLVEWFQLPFQSEMDLP
jgi:hypothetical protein